MCGFLSWLHTPTNFLSLIKLIQILYILGLSSIQCILFCLGGILTYMNDPTLKVVYTTENPSICLLYNNRTGEHSIWKLRQTLNEVNFEKLEVLANHFDLNFIYFFSQMKMKTFLLKIASWICCHHWRSYKNAFLYHESQDENYYLQSYEESAFILLYFYVPYWFCPKLTMLVLWSCL